MIQFQCDYEEGACPQILERLMATNLEQTVGYSEDEYCKQAREKIKKACDAAELPCLLIEVDRQMTNYEQARTMLEGFKDMLA